MMNAPDEIRGADSPTAEEIRALFNKVLETSTDPDRIANLELCREYFANPRFRAWLQDTTWAIVKAQEAQEAHALKR